MEKVVILVLVLACFGLQTDSSVFIPFDNEYMIPTMPLKVVCIVNNENFEGWFRDDTGSRIPPVASWNDIKDQPAVVAVRGYYVLVFPKGSSPSLGGKYTCKGDSNHGTVTVYARFNLDKLETRQAISAGKSGKIVLGAISYPLSKFTWKKDNVPLDFSGGRLKLEKDGSIVFSNVLNSDAGKYEVQISWQNRKIANVKIDVKVSI